MRLLPWYKNNFIRHVYNFYTKVIFLEHFHSHIHLRWYLVSHQKVDEHSNERITKIIYLFFQNHKFKLILPYINWQYQTNSPMITEMCERHQLTILPLSINFHRYNIPIKRTLAIFTPIVTKY